MRRSKLGLTAMLMSTLLFAGTAWAQGTGASETAPAPKAGASATTEKPATPPAAAKAEKPAAAKEAKAATAKPKAATGGPKEIVGEVIDPACWIINGTSGKGHAECAAACAKAGQTLAILEKKTQKVYILAGESPGQDPNKGVIEYIGQPVLVKGRVFARGGALGIQVTSIEPYNMGKITAAP
jgi:hypothetical protein